MGDGIGECWLGTTPHRAGAGDTGHLPGGVHGAQHFAQAEAAVRRAPLLSPLLVDLPVTFEVEFKSTAETTFATSFPSVKRTGPKSVSVTAPDVVSAFKMLWGVFELGMASV